MINNSTNVIGNVHLGLGRYGMFPIFPRSFPLLLIRTLLHMGNTLTILPDTCAVVYGRPTPFSKFFQLLPGLAHETGNEKSVCRIFPWRAPDHTFRMVCWKRQTTARLIDLTHRMANGHTGHHFLRDTTSVPIRQHLGPGCEPKTIQLCFARFECFGDHMFVLSRVNATC